MIFPIIQPQISEGKKELPLYREVKWDFEHNAPMYAAGNPVIVERAEAVLSWAVRALMTERFRHEIYTWDYGSGVTALVGTPFSGELKTAEAARYVRECLMVNPYIKDVADIAVDFSGDVLKIKCTLKTIYGETEVKI